jgi:DNA-binding transcriptional MocR family regulator
LLLCFINVSAILGLATCLATRSLHHALPISVLREAAIRYLNGALHIPPIDAGLATPAFYSGTSSSRDIESAADARGVEALALDRFVLERPPVRGLLLGFAAFDPNAISRHMQILATVLEQPTGGARRCAPYDA